MSEMLEFEMVGTSQVYILTEDWTELKGEEWRNPESLEIVGDSYSWEN